MCGGRIRKVDDGRREMVLFSGFLVTSDLVYQETEEVLVSRFNEMSI
jgi:hypothetical protein